MELKKFIFLSTGILFLMGTSVMPGRSFSAIDGSAEHIQKLPSLEIDYKSIVLAQNNPQTTESDTRKTNEDNDQASESESATTENNSKKSNDTAAKPLKPFKPSEEIAAEQAVDFPVDI